MNHFPLIGFWRSDHCESQRATECWQVRVIKTLVTALYQTNYRHTLHTHPAFFQTPHQT